MKVTPIDFLLSGFFMALLWGLAWLLCFVFLEPSLVKYFGIYASVANILLFVSFYGLFSGLLLQLMLKIRTLKCGEFTSESHEFTYWKLLTVLHYFGLRALFLFQVAPAQPMLARLFGAKVGSNVAIGGFLDSPFLISIGDNCTVGNSSIVSGNLSVNGKLIIGKIQIGANSTVGVFSTVMPNTKMGQNTILGPNSILTVGAQIPDGESWKGHPARKWL